MKCGKCLSPNCGYAAHTTGHAHHPTKGLVSFGGWCCGRCQDKDDFSHGPCCEQVKWAHSFADVNAEVKRRQGLTPAQRLREVRIAMGQEDVVMSDGARADGRQRMDVKECHDDDDGFLNQLKRNLRMGLVDDDGDNDAVSHPGDPPMTPIDQNLSDPDGDRALRKLESESPGGNDLLLFSREPMEVEAKVEEGTDSQRKGHTEVEDAVVKVEEGTDSQRKGLTDLKGRFKGVHS